MYFDTHAHYDDEQFDPDRDELLSSMPENGVELIVDPGSDLRSSLKAANIAEKYPFVYAAAGIHPHDASTADADTCNEIIRLAARPKVIAIGEIGLDYYYDHSPRVIQKEAFAEQLEIARQLKMPVITHEREACADFLDIISGFCDVPGVVHCFSGSWETAKIILDMGWCLSFTGSITFKNARRAPEVIKNIPSDRFFIETDSPYLAPVPNRGRRNCSLNLPYIAAKIGELRGISAEEAAHAALVNGKRFFGIY